MPKTALYNVFRQFTKIPFIESWLASQTQGKSKGSFISKIPLNYTQYQQPSKRVVARNGVFYELDISDYQEWIVYFGIEVEPRKYLYNLIQEGDQIFDIGANIGEIAMQMAKKTGSKGLVYAFEPSPLIHNKLQQNLALNDFKNLRTFQLALGENNGFLEMSTPNDRNRGGNRIVETGTGNYEVQVQSLDYFIEKNKVSKIDLLKIDVEGFELKLLQGAENTIKNFRPTLFIEICDDHLKYNNTSAKELLTFISRYYPSLTNANDGKKIELSSNFDGCFFDLVAKSND